ncbi:hypothetical protein KFK09_000139 [Dendrobium nobile]|uniref:Uncharacterized protein n=1 Tax=Dendrobium nobile TaxID=94219 RepID=A0A8T3C7Q0_DENNO|nr:hypothetical protein KFK09_000139 [Dendrobium nobile]
MDYDVAEARILVTLWWQPLVNFFELLGFRDAFSPYWMVRSRFRGCWEPRPNTLQQDQFFLLL